MTSISHARVLPFLLGVLLAGVATVRAAHADTVFLSNGNLLHGQLDATQLAVVTPGGVVQVQTADLSDVVLDTMGGDVLRYKNGSALAGTVDLASYSVRLSSGQTIVIERGRVKEIRFRSR